MTTFLRLTLTAAFVLLPTLVGAQAPATPPAAPETPPGPAAGAESAAPEGAAPDTTAAPAPEDGAETKADKADIALSDEQVLHEEKEGVEEKRDSSDPYEDPDESYFFLGAMGAVVVLPSFMFDFFMDESISIVNPAVGAEFTYRSDGFSIVVDGMYVGYRGDGGFRLPGEPKTDTEYIESSLSALMLSVTFLWSTEFSKYVALEYGAGIGVGVLLGDIVRTEAYPDGDGWAKCSGPNSGQGGDAGYCDGPPVGKDDRGAHYGVTGDKPPVWPWLALPQIGLRIKPIRQLQLRVNASVGVGFQFGASAAYGF